MIHSDKFVFEKNLLFSGGVFLQIGILRFERRPPVHPTVLVGLEHHLHGVFAGDCPGGGHRLILQNDSTQHPKEKPCARPVNQHVYVHRLSFVQGEYSNIRYHTLTEMRLSPT